MTVHAGQSYTWDDVSIGSPDPQALLKISPSPDVAEEVKALSWAQTTSHVHYFSIYASQALVGQIYLHDIDAQSGDALIGYHLFQLCDRGKGVGTKGLALLQQHVVTETALQRLIIITGRDNRASRGIAVKCGFSDIGGAREDPENLVVYEWRVEG